MLFYVQQVISPVFPLVIKYFYHLYNLYCRSKNENDRLNILEDIELSVVTFAEACDALIQSINGSDWIQAQPSQMDGGGIRYGTPKLYAYYAAMLNGLADLFQEKDNREYGFCVYPALKSRPEVELLFTTIKERGKVGVIRVPGQDIANVNYLCKLLVHEFYHIVPGSELRLRKVRAQRYLKILMYDIRDRIFEGVEITPWTMEKLQQLFFDSKLADISGKLDAKHESDRDFYSSEIKLFYANTLIGCLNEILHRTTRDMFEAVYDENEFLNCIAPYVKEMQNLERARRRINDNILEVLSHNYIYNMCSFHMEIFREVYADVSTILTLKSDPESWFSAFRYHPTDKDDYRNNLYIYLRACLVCKVMTEECNFQNDGELFKVWKKWWEILKREGSEDNFLDGIRKEFFVLENEVDCKDSDWKKERVQSYDSPEVLVFSERRIIWDYYVDYFRRCRDKLLQKEYAGAEFSHFRDKFFLNGKITNISLLNNISMRKWE